MDSTTRSNRSDEELIQAYLNGEEGALRTLIARYLRSVYHFAYRYTANRLDAEDIAQEVFVKIWKNLKRYDERTRFRVWLFAIAKNTTIDWLRKRRIAPVSPLDNEALADTLADPTPLPPELIEAKTVASTVGNATDKLDPDVRVVLRFRYEEGLTFRQIAELLKKPLHTVKSQHRRALAKLKKLLAER